MKTSKKILSMVLTVIMLLSVVPMVYAEGETYKTGDILQFGSYPQTKVTDETLIAELNALAPEWEDWTSYGYYSGTGDYGTMVQGDWMRYIDVTNGGNKYRAVKFTQYRPYSVYGTSYENNGYSTNTVYWFKFEAIDWRVLDPITGLVMSESIIDAQPYSNTLYYNSKYWSKLHVYAFSNDASYINYASDYATSSIRKWLNDDFYNTAFTDNEKKEIGITTLNNDGYYTLTGEKGLEALDSAETSDKIFLLSKNEAENSNFGFGEGDRVDIARQAQGSDYAKSQGLGVFKAEEYYGKSNWLLRSPGSTSRYCCYVFAYGQNSMHEVGYTSDGVRPALRFNQISNIGQSEHKHDYRSVVTAPTCTEAGSTIYTCACGDTYTETIPSKGHTYGADDENCQICGFDRTEECSCRCHKDNFFAKLIWKITFFFNKIFRRNQECACGIAHY